MNGDNPSGKGWKVARAVDDQGEEGMSGRVENDEDPQESRSDEEKDRRKKRRARGEIEEGALFRFLFGGCKSG